jgi:hypothetical protein
MLRRFVHRDSTPKRNASILTTAVKRMERDATKKTKSVHFKLKKKTEVIGFSPLNKGSNCHSDLAHVLGAAHVLRLICLGHSYSFLRHLLTPSS